VFRKFLDRNLAEIITNDVLRDFCQLLQSIAVLLPKIFPTVITPIFFPVIKLFNDDLLITDSI